MNLHILNLCHVHVVNRIFFNQIFKAICAQNSDLCAHARASFPPLKYYAQRHSFLKGEKHPACNSKTFCKGTNSQQIMILTRRSSFCKPSKSPYFHLLFYCISICLRLFRSHSNKKPEKWGVGGKLPAGRGVHRRIMILALGSSLNFLCRFRIGIPPFVWDQDQGPVCIKMLHI